MEDQGTRVVIFTMSATNKLTDRINEFFTLQGDGLEEYLSEPRPVEEAVDSFMSDLSFGTAGLRAEMGVGFNRMNKVTVGIATMGIAAYLKDRLKGSKGLIVLGHDHRHNSAEFARIAGKIYKLYGHEVKLLPGVVPTPFVPSTIQCEGRGVVSLGVMITASHNPKKDNGYKVYDSNGAQISDPTAKEISEYIRKERGNYLQMIKGMEGIELAEDEELLKRVTGWYIEKIKGFLGAQEERKSVGSLSVVYTALHGVGADYVDAVFKEVFNDPDYKYKLIHVPEQRNPDPDFPTVDFPNPEEGLSTLKMAMGFADAQGISVIFANDPDADRFCVAERAGNGGGWRVFNGNEIAVLLADYLETKMNNDNDNNSNCAMLSSCVSSRFLEGFCSRRGWRHEMTSTGFKNLGNRGLQLKEEGWRVLFAYEEAIGFQVGDWNFDKDGISALLTFYNLLLTSDNTKSSIQDRLKGIYERESCWPVQFNGYYMGATSGKIKEILSTANAPDLPFLKSFERSASSSSQLKFEFEIEGFGSAWLMLRPSGTEPKLKFYSEMLLRSEEKLLGAEEKLRQAVDEIVGEILRSSSNSNNNNSNSSDHNSGCELKRNQ